MHHFFYILLIILFSNTPFTLQANESSDDEEKEFFSPEEDIFFSSYEMSESDNESNNSVKIYSSDSNTEDETNEEDLSQANPYAADYNEKIEKFLQQAKKLNDAFTTSANHEKLDAHFPKYYYEAGNRFNLFSNYFNVYPYSIRFEIKCFKEILNAMIETLPIESKNYLEQNPKLDFLTLDRIIEKLEDSKNTNITINQFLIELENINEILVQAGVFLETFLKSERVPLIDFDISEEDALISNVIISSSCEEDTDDEREGNN